MASWIASGHLVEAIIALTVAEWLGLSLLNRWTGRGPSPVRLGSLLLPGVFLLLALRAALVSSGWVVIAAALTAALFAHMADLAARWNE